MKNYMFLVFILSLFLLVQTTSVSALNQKNMNMYQDGQVFMISDRNWRNVLSLVPLTTWTDLSEGGTVHKYPTLAYREQSEPPALNLEMILVWESGDGKYHFNPNYGLKAKIDQSDSYTYFNGIMEEGSKYCDGTPSSEESIALIDNYFENELLKFGETTNLVFVLKSCDGMEHTLTNLQISGFMDFHDTISFSFHFGDFYIPAGQSITVKKPVTYDFDFQESFDADSLLHFLKQYREAKPNIKVTAASETQQELWDLISSEVNPNEIETFDSSNPGEYLSYWNNVDMVFVVDYENYEAGLMTSVFASYFNAPLFFVDYENIYTYEPIFKNIKVISVGAIDSVTELILLNTASEFYSLSLEELERLYTQITLTDKLIMVNPSDLDDLGIHFYPEKSEGVVSGFTSASLAAPYLAAAKHEVIVSVHSNNYQQVDTELDEHLEWLDGADKFNYLTIFASPVKITTDFLHESYNRPFTADEAIYADTNGNFIPDLAAGRIYGISTTDVFSYVATDLFHELFDTPNKALVILGSGNSIILKKGSVASTKYFLELLNLDVNHAYADEEYNLPDISNLEDLSFVSYDGHGSTGAWAGTYSSSDFINKDIWFKPSIFLSDTCSTCSFKTLSNYQKHILFCSQILRRGALAHFGALDITYDDRLFSVLLTNDIYSGLSFGKSFRNNFEKTYANTLPVFYKLSNFLLLGDPTIVFNDGSAFSSIDFQSVSQELTPDGNLQVTLHLPASFIIADATYKTSHFTSFQQHFLSFFYNPSKTLGKRMYFHDFYNYYDEEQTQLESHRIFDYSSYHDHLTLILPDNKKHKKLGKLKSFTIVTSDSEIFVPIIEEVPYAGAVCPHENSFFQPECNTYKFELPVKHREIIEQPDGPIEISIKDRVGYIGVYSESIDGKHVIHYYTPSYLFPEEEGAFEPDEFPDYAPARDIIMEIELVGPDASGSDEGGPYADGPDDGGPDASGPEE